MQAQTPDYAAIVQELANAYVHLHEVDAVAWAGSINNAVADDASDIDVYIYAHADVPLDARARIAHARGTRVEVGNTFWESGDEWDERASGVHIDIMFRSLEWLEEQVDRLLVQHQASVGYSTCFWHNILTSQIVYDRTGDLRRLQAKAHQPYPDALREAIFAKNVPLLRDAHGAYLHQIAKAAKRDDLVSLNHRVAALLASYFDILFALNRKPHPGEKRLLALVQRDCPVRPDNMDEQVRALLAAAGTNDQTTVDLAAALIDDLIAVLTKEGIPTVDQR